MPVLGLPDIAQCVLAAVCVRKMVSHFKGAKPASSAGHPCQVCVATISTCTHLGTGTGVSHFANHVTTGAKHDCDFSRMLRCSQLPCACVDCLRTSTSANFTLDGHLYRKEKQTREFRNVKKASFTSCCNAESLRTQRITRLRFSCFSSCSGSKCVYDSSHN